MLKQQFFVKSSIRATAALSISRIVELWCPLIAHQATRSLSFKNLSTVIEQTTRRKSTSSSEYNSAVTSTNTHLPTYPSIKLTKFINQPYLSNLINSRSLTNRYRHLDIRAIYHLTTAFQMTPNTTTIINKQISTESSCVQKDERRPNDVRQEDDVICKFGVITDAQFANCDDRPAWYNKEKQRYYRGAITHLRNAFNYWDQLIEKPKFVLQLGDLIDGLNTQEEGCNSLEALEETFKLFEQFGEIATFHAVGNHELYNFSRTDIALLFRESLINRGRLNPDRMHLQLDFHDLSDENTLLYYKFQPQTGIKVIALDCFDISVIGHSPESEKYKQAAEILCKNNHSNFDLWDFDEHLEGLNKRFQTQNGGFSKNQLHWLKSELKESQQNGEKVIVFGHTGIHPESCDASCLAYNYDEVLEIFDQFSCIICYLSGHAHSSGYSMDENGIHYIVLHGIIETDPLHYAFATITIKKDTLILEGKGAEQSLVLPLRTSNVLSVDTSANDK